MQNLKINTVRPRSYRERSISDGFNLFVENHAGSDLVDEFFNRNNIVSLKFKSKTWSKLKSMCDREVYKAIRNYFNEPKLKVSFSDYVGCSMCPCSPGYRIRGVRSFSKETPFDGMWNTNVWATVHDLDLSKIKAALPKFQKMLEEEIKSHEND